MSTRSRFLFAALLTLAGVTWLAPWRSAGTVERRLALEGPLREGLKGAPERAVAAPIAAPASGLRTAAATATTVDAVEASGLVVRLRDTAGAPLEGVSIRFAAVDTARRLADSLNRYERTDAAGEARLTAGSVEALFGMEPAGRVAVGCFDEQPAATQRVTVARRPLPTEPIELMVDAIPVHVGVVLPNGERWHGAHGVLWRYERGWYSSTGGESPVRIWVVRGEPYSVRVYGAGLYEHVEETFAPIAPLERQRTHDLILGSELAGLRATLLRSDGTPLPEDTLVELRSSRIDENGESSSSHASGEVRFRVQPALETGQQRTVWLVAADSGSAGHGRWRSEVVYHVPPPGEWTDLGAVTLEAEPLLVAGRVVPPPGMPLDSVGIELESIDGNGRWARLPDLGNCVWVDGGGHFAIHGPAPDTALRIRAELGFRNDLVDHVAVLPPRTEPSSTDVVVRIVEAGAVRFHVAGGDDVSYDQLDISTVPEDGTEPRTLDASEVLELVDAEADGTYVVRRLPPGRVSITPRIEPGGVALGAPLHVAVRAGETTDGGALVIDDRVRWVELTVTDHAWALADIVRYGPHGAPLSLRAEVQSNGVARLGLSDAGGVDVVVGGESLAPVFLAAVQAPCTVTLDAHPAVTIVVAGLEQLAVALGDAACDRALVVQLTPFDGEPWAALSEPALMRRQSFSKRLDDPARMGEPASLHIAPGRYAVHAAIVPEGRADERWLGPEHGHRFAVLGEIVVVPDVPMQSAQVQVDLTLR